MTATGTRYIPVDQDTYQFSIMSYNSYDIEPTAVPLNPQLYDIAGLQALYGPNNSTAAGDTVYTSFSSGNQDVLTTIWDGGGTDTIDTSGYSQPSYVDLRPGYFSSIGPTSNVTVSSAGISPGTGNVAIAFGTYIENAKGGSANDLLVGNVFSNTLMGGGGDDYIYGDEGAYDKRFGDYRIVAAGGSASNPSGALGAFIEDHTKQVDTLIGGAGNDTLSASKGNDTLWGGDQGIDSQTDNQTDTVDYSEGSQPVTINYDGTGTVANLTVNDGTGGMGTLHSIEVIKATPGQDTFTFNGKINPGYHLTVDFDGGQPAGRASVVNAKGSTDLNGMKVAIDQNGSAVLKASAGDGAITLQNFGHSVIGSDFGDTISLSGSGSRSSALSHTSATGQSGAFALGGNGDDTITATDGDNDLYGGDGDDTITGGSGRDIISGGAGYDVLSGGAGDDLIHIGSATPLTPTIAGTADGGAGNDKFVMQGGDGSVELHGGSGDDIYMTTSSALNSSADEQVTINAGDGHDTIYRSGFYEPYNFGGGAINGFPAVHFLDANIEDARIIWNAHVIEHRDGNLYGLEGDLAVVINTTGESILFKDVVGTEETGDGQTPATGSTLGVYATSSIEFKDAVWVRPLEGESNLEVDFGDTSAFDTASGEYAGRDNDPSQTVIGTSDADTLAGQSGDDTIAGGDGNDLIDSSMGNDHIDGGPGSDQFRILESLGDFTRSDPTGLLVLTSNDGTEGISTLTNVETIVSITDQASYDVQQLLLEFGTAGNDTIKGTPFADTITGLAGNDIIYPGLGNDTVDGGDGVDTLNYMDVAAAVTVNLTITTPQNTAGAGIDQLINVENLSGTAYADSLNGDANANVINAGDGDDHVLGNDGNDTLFGNNGNDTIYGNVGNDSLNGGMGDDYLNGGMGSDTLVGGVGNDTLVGGAAADTLTGSGGSNIFLYAAVSDSTPSAYDVITDFVSGTDKINLTAIHTSGSDLFTITRSGGNTLVNVDLGGNGSIDMLIQATGANKVVSGDILWSTGSGSAARPSAGAAADLVANDDDAHGHGHVARALPAHDWHIHAAIA